MYLLYLDESGNPDDAADRHFVLGGAAVFERVTHFLTEDLDRVQSRHFPGAPPVEFHAAEVRAGTGFWRRIPHATRRDVLREIVAVIQNANHPGLVLFAASIEKSASLYGEPAVRRATEEICRRFDIFLKRRHAARDTQRGLLVFAAGRAQQRSRIWVKGFREAGTQWGTLRNLVDIPYFASPKETRLLQLADFVAHAVYLLYERRNPELLGPILKRFDHREGEGVVHGLLHVSERRTTCNCPACVSRRSPGSLGPWLENPAST